MSALILGILGVLVSAPPEVRTIVEFDGHPDERLQVTGRWVIERKRELVRSGTGSLRMTLGPPEKWPGVRVTSDRLNAAGWRWLVVDVYVDAPFKLSVRLDDAIARKNNQERLYRGFDLVRGWNRVAVDLKDPGRTASGRVLDVATLSFVVLYAHQPKVDRDVLVDHLRLERPAGSGTESGRKKLVKAFDRAYRKELPVKQRRTLLRGIDDADVPERCKAIGRRVLRDDGDPRVLPDAIRLLGRTRLSASVERAIQLTDRAKGPPRWRWIDALGRMRVRAARDHVFEIALSSRSNPDRIAALQSLQARNDTSLIPLCRAELDGSWQVRATRVALLRTIVNGEAFPELTRYLKDPAPRVGQDALEALVAIAGRDLGENADAWIAWWKVNREKLGGSGLTAAKLRSPYGTYYGMPLHPGRLCFVIDVSGSMKTALNPTEAAYVQKARHLRGRKVTNRLDLVREEARRAIMALPKIARVQLIWFEGGVFVWSKQGAMQATTANKDDLSRKLDTLVASGGTNIHGALVRAFVPDDRYSFKKLFAESVDTIYFLTDGQPGVGITNPAHLVADIQETNRVRRVRINTIGMGRKDNQVLRELAAVTGGTYVDLAK